MLRLLRNIGLFRQIMEPYFAQFGISGPQWAILRILQHASDCGESALPQKEISHRLLIQPPSVTALVDRLERMGLLQRGSSDDLRVRLVALTGSGKKLIGAIQASHPEQVRSLFAGFTSSELDVFHDLLGKLAAHLAALASQTPLPAPASANPAKAKPRSRRFPRTQ